MIVPHRPRRLAAAAVWVVLALALSACAQEYPNTTFSPNTEFGRAIDDLWDRLLFWGTLVFILVEAALEITWTLIPAVILILIAVPTVRTIFATQADAPGDAVQIEVIGHQWWWEFRYPELGISTANEFYIPVGRTAAFTLRTADVLHSFWVPQLGGKRDLITNRTNFLWFTPDTSAENAWNGFCAEYCGASHANMKFRAFTVSEEQFQQWVELQRAPALYGAVAAPGAAPAPAAGAAQPGAGAAAPGTTQPGAGTTAPAGTQAASPGAGAAQPGVAAPPQPAALPSQFYAYPREQVPAHIIPNAPIPNGLTYDTTLTGDVERGRELYARSACIGCHRIRGAPSPGVIGPELTHFGSRITLGAGMYPNDMRHLALWIKNAQRMKPGAIMPPFGEGERDVRTGAVGALTDQQIADIAAYLLALR